MSKGKVHGYTVRVPEDGWRLDCLVPNCIRFVSIYRGGYVIDRTCFRSELHQLVCEFRDAKPPSIWEPSSTAGRGGMLDQLYWCTEHREEVDS